MPGKKAIMNILEVFEGYTKEEIFSAIKLTKLTDEERILYNLRYGLEGEIAHTPQELVNILSCYNIDNINIENIYYKIYYINHKVLINLQKVHEENLENIKLNNANKVYVNGLKYEKNGDIINALKSYREYEKVREQLFLKVNTLTEREKEFLFSTKAIIKIIWLYYNSGNLDEAILSIDECIELTSKYIFNDDLAKKQDEFIKCLRYQKAKILYNLGKYDEALYNLNNENIYSIKLVAMCNYLIGKTNDAEKIFDSIFEEISEDNEELLNNFAFDIGYFFHKLSDETSNSTEYVELLTKAYKYYKYSPNYRKYILSSSKNTENYLKKRQAEYNNPDKIKSYSAFNFEPDLNIFNKVVDNMNKTNIIQGFDLYVVHCNDAGYEFVDDKKIQNDYIMIFTLPGTKIVVNAYPTNKVLKENVKYSVLLDDIKSQNIKLDKYNFQDNNKYYKLKKNID